MQAAHTNKRCPLSIIFAGVPLSLFVENTHSVENTQNLKTSVDCRPQGEQPYLEIAEQTRPMLGIYLKNQLLGGSELGVKSWRFACIFMSGLS